MTSSKPRLTLSMVVRNESGRYLQQALERHRRFIDDAVIIDDGSTDDTAELCERALEGVPLKLIRNKTSQFHNEIVLRQSQWEHTLSVEPEWILSLDADEWFEDRFADAVGDLLQEKETCTFCFRLYDFWGETVYRDDALWCAHRYYRPFLHRFKPGFDYRWNEQALHCGRFPANVFQLPNTLSDLRLKHYGWANKQDRARKFIRYMRLDPDGRHGNREQYLSIMDRHPNTVLWSEEE